MPRSPSWIDPDALVESLGDSAGARPHGLGQAEEAARPEAEDSAGAGPRGPEESAGAIRPEAEDSGGAVPSTRRPLSGLPVGALDALSHRVELFQRWIRTLVGDRPFFVTDAEGLMLVTERVPADRAVVGPIVERALRVVRPFLGSARTRSAHVELEDGQHLQMLWHRTDRGRVVFGVFGDPLLDADRVDWVGRALERVFAKERPS